MIFLFFGRFARWIPSATLAALIMMTAANLLKLGEMKKAFALSREEGIVAAATLGGTIFLPILNWAIYLGVILSFIVYFRNSSEAHVRILSEGARVFIIRFKRVTSVDLTCAGSFPECGPGEARSFSAGSPRAWERF